MSVQPIVAIVGPTAVGKTAVGIEVAHRLDGEIVSADSQAVYRGMDIGTAKPTKVEREQAAFHLIDVVDPDETYNVGRFKAQALEALRTVAAHGRRVIVVGGTGLYVKALLDDYNLAEQPADPVVRANLEAAAEDKGSPYLHDRLAVLDPESAARIHPNDLVRIVRALEVVTVTGVRISARHMEDALLRHPIASIRFGLRLPRDEMYRRIDARVDGMLAAGLEQEVRDLIDRYGSDIRSLRSLGYKEVTASIKGGCTRDAAIEDIKRNTRRFARRQLTWFRADRQVVWLDVEGVSAVQIADEIVRRCETVQ